MGEKKPTPRGTIVVAAAAIGGVVAVNVAQGKSTWAMETSLNTAIVAVVAAVVCGVVAWFVTAKRRG